MVGGEAEAEQEGIQVESVLERRDDGEGAALACEEGRGAEAELDGVGGERQGRARQWGDGGGAALSGRDLDGDCMGQQGPQGVDEELLDLPGVLVGDQPHGDFGRPWRG